MAIIYRAEKGSALTIEELDGNFKELDERLLSLEKENIHRKLQTIEMKGNDILFIDQVGQVIATLPYPILRFVPRGDWIEGTEYIQNDLVTQKGAAYVCLKSHVAESFITNHWQKLIELSDQKSSHQGKMTFAIHTPQMLPKEPEVGQIVAIITKDNKLSPVYWDGKSWLNLTTNEISKEI